MSTQLWLLHATHKALCKGWDQRPYPAASCIVLYLTPAWSLGFHSEKTTSSTLFCPKSAEDSRLAKQLWFSTVILSQPKPALNGKSSWSAPVGKRAKLFADNNITQEGGISSPCLPSGLDSKDTHLHPGDIVIENLWRQAWLWGLTILAPCMQKITSISLLVCGDGCRQGEGKAHSTCCCLSMGTTTNTSPSQK